jgi:ABC-type polysaccharide/polyol phosphate transport system ATPase subunit
VTATYPIRAEGAGKQYVKYEDTPMLVTAALQFRNRTRRSRLWAVRNVDLDVERGTCVGVIGRNGSGKSTLLQMIAGVTAPTEGTVTVRGRVAPLISVGVGFHPELTGRENVFVNGSILGMTRRQIEQRLDAIVDFSEVEAFIDTPVKFYSSGMAVRLGFSVAIHAEPEVLLVDEVLAVGDLAFQLKSFDRMMEIRAAGSTILVVTHNLNSVRTLCERTVVLHMGEQRFDGDTTDAISLFHELMAEPREMDDSYDDDATSEYRGGVAEIESVTILDADGQPTANLPAAAPITLRVVILAHKDVEDSTLGLAIGNERGVIAYSDNNRKFGGMGPLQAGGRYEVDVQFEMRLVTGSYKLRCSLVDSDLVTKLSRSKLIGFYVSGRGFVNGVADLNAVFGVRRAEAGEHPPAVAKGI